MYVFILLFNLMYVFILLFNLKYVFILLSNLMYVFILFWGCAGSLLLRGLQSSCSAQGYSLVGVTAYHRGGFSRRGAQALGCMGSVDESSRLNSCGAWTQLLRGVWDLPGPGKEPVSPALAGGFFTMDPPGMPWSCLLQQLVYLNTQTLLKENWNLSHNPFFLLSLMYYFKKVKKKDILR